MVLVAGGDDITAFFPFPPYRQCWNCTDPEKADLGFTGSLNTARDLHNATLLTNGMAGPRGSRYQRYPYRASAELYDPAKCTWTFTGSARELHSATLLTNGMALAAGGFR